MALPDTGMPLGHTGSQSQNIDIGVDFECNIE